MPRHSRINDLYYCKKIKKLDHCFQILRKKAFYLYYKVIVCRRHEPPSIDNPLPQFFIKLGFIPGKADQQLQGMEL